MNCNSTDITSESSLKEFEWFFTRVLEWNNSSSIFPLEEPSELLTSSENLHSNIRVDFTRISMVSYFGLSSSEI